MWRGRVKQLLTGIIAIALMLSAHNGTAQNLNIDPANDENVVVRDVKPELETMGLTWILEGDKKRLAYVVQTGDTMWDIAERYLNSPYYWPKIWERNAFVINPHLIFPGDILYPYPEGVTEQPAFSPGSTVIDISLGDGAVIGKKQVTNISAGATGFVLISELESAGKITENYDGKELLGQNDAVFVNVGKRDRVIVGDRYNIFRVDENPITGKYIVVRHPATGEKIGYQIANLGDLYITKVESEVSEGVIEKSYQEIRNGDMIKPFLQPMEEKVDVTGTEVELLKGYIIANLNNVKLLGKNDIVYIDRGKDDNVMRGNVFTIYEPCEVITDRISREKIKIPEKIIGHIVVIDAKDKTSSALITDAESEIAIGDKVLMSKYTSWEIEGVSQKAELSKCAYDPECKVISAEDYEAGADIPYCEGEVNRLTRNNKKKKK